MSHPSHRVLCQNKKILATVAYKNLEVNHIDIKTAFVYGDLEEVFMAQPEEYVVPCEQSNVCMLNKACYSLKQAVRNFHVKIGVTLKRLRFVQTTVPSVRAYLYETNAKTRHYIIVHVDDLLTTRKNEQ